MPGEKRSSSDTASPLLAGGNDPNDFQESEAGPGVRKLPKSHGITSAEASALLAQYGRNELVEKKTPKWKIFCSMLFEPMVRPHRERMLHGFLTSS